MISTQEHNVLVATRNQFVIDVYDIGHSIPSSDEMNALEVYAARKGLALHLIEVSGSEEMSFKDVIAELAQIESARVA
jgi:hypothetical protein